MSKCKIKKGLNTCEKELVKLLLNLKETVEKGRLSVPINNMFRLRPRKIC